ncbi:MAG: mitochondrial fission ELM1 family protein [Rhizobiaceae bacterium]
MALDVKILILSDGKTGDLVQCRGVARSMTGAANIREHVVKPRGFWALPLPMMPVAPLERRSEIFDEPLPDIVIASGRRTVPHMRVFAAIERGPFTVILKDPRQSRGEVDVIWAPVHDGLKGENVFSTLTAPHTISKDTLDTVAPAALIELEINGHAAGVILGGDSGQVKWTADVSARFADALRSLPADETPVVVTSRRTPDVLRDAVEAALPTAIWPERGGLEQPYLKTLAAADRLIITGDSHNMVSEALATGAAVHVFRPPGLNRKLERFLDALEVQKLVGNMANGFDRGRQEPLDATPEIAAEFERRYLLKMQ